MARSNKLMDMLVGYAAAHQHPVNVAAHFIGIPAIMLGMFIPMTWLEFQFAGFSINLAQLGAVGFFLFYLTLDALFAVVFLVGALLVAEAAYVLGGYPLSTASTMAAVGFFGGYALQFAGHAVEKSMPVLVKHPIQANIAAPFFVIVEVFGLLGLRKQLFEDVNQALAERRVEEAGAAT